MTHSFIYSFNMHLLSAYASLYTVVSARAIKAAMIATSGIWQSGKEEPNVGK